MPQPSIPPDGPRRLAPPQEPGEVGTLLARQPEPAPGAIRQQGGPAARAADGPVARESTDTTTSKRNALPHKPARAHLLRQKIEGMAYQGGDGHVVPEFMEMSLSSITKVLARSLGVEPHDLKAEKHLIKQIASDVLSEKFTASQLRRAQNSLEARFVQQGEQAKVDLLVSHSSPDADPTSFLGLNAPGFNAAPASIVRNQLAMMLAFRTADTDSKGVVGMRGLRFCLEYLIYFNRTWDTIEGIDTSREGRITLQELIRSALNTASQCCVRARFGCHSDNG